MASTLIAAAIFAASPRPAAAQLTSIGSQFWDQDAPSIEGSRELGDTFGAALAVGDFNCDGIDDLAIGVPYEDITFDCDEDGSAGSDECTNAGAVAVIYGSPQGLHASLGEADQLLTQATSGVPGDPEFFDHFGSALASTTAGSTNPCDDLAVGVPDEDINRLGIEHVDAGAVYYFRGTTSGLVADGMFAQGQDGIGEFPDDNDHFGQSLSAGPSYTPFDPKCSPPDYIVRTLLIGVPGEQFLGGPANEGGVQLVTAPCDPPTEPNGSFPSRYACSAELAGPNCALYGSDVVGMEQFGWALAGGSDFSFAATGAPYDDQFATDGGSVLILLKPDAELCTQGANGAPGTVESFDRQGYALAIGDFDGDQRDDLLAGVPFEDIESSSADGGGAVNVYFGGDDGYPQPSPDTQMFDQDDFTDAAAQANDHFGRALAAGDFDGDGVADAAIGVPEEDIEVTGPDVLDAGAVHVLYGVKGFGLGTAGNQTYTLDHANIPGDSIEDDHLGEALAAGDFDGDGLFDLAVGAPGESSSVTTGGGVYILFGGTGNGFLTRIEFAESENSHAEGNTAVVLTLERVGNRVYPISVGYNDAAAGTATAGSDYQSLGGTLTWGAGDSTPRQITVNLLEDTLDEPSETIVLDLTPETGPGVDHSDSFTILIQDDDVAGSMQFAGACGAVGESVGSVSVSVTRIGGSASGVTVHYESANGSATAGADYTAVSGTLTFAAGDTTESFSIPILNDATDEAAQETIRLTLSSPGGFGSLGSLTTRTVTIVDNDDPDHFFADNFECGNTAAWSGTVP